jgi:hypothetical protein
MKVMKVMKVMNGQKLAAFLPASLPSLTSPLSLESIQ